MNFSPKELSTVSNALWVAAEQFKLDAAAFEGSPQFERIRDQFQRQHDECRVLLLRIEREG